MQKLVILLVIKEQLITNKITNFCI